jgi:replicative DNA helicase
MKTTRKPQIDIDDAIRNEECVIGSILLDPKVADRLAGLRSDSFADKELGQLFELIQSLHESGQAIDLVTMLGPAKSLGIDAARLGRLFSSVPTTAHAVFYRDNVLEASRRRKLADLAAELSSMATDATTNSAEIVAELESRLDDLRSNQRKRAVSIADGIDRLLAEIDRSSGQRRRAESGLPCLDSVLGGFMPGEMVVLAARPGCGKTALGMQVAMHNATKGRSVLFVSLEMPESELVARVLAGLGDVPVSAIRSGQITPQQRQRICDAREQVKAVPLKIIDPSIATMRDLRSEARAQHAANGLDLLVIDYLGLVETPGSKKENHEDKAEVSRSIKRLAKELSIPVLTLQQLNRESEKAAEPMLSHLRDSGSIEQDADAVLFLNRPQDREQVRGPDDPIETHLLVAKNRHGRTGRANLMFHPKRTTFFDPRATVGWQP